MASNAEIDEVVAEARKQPCMSYDGDAAYTLRKIAWLLGEIAKRLPEPKE